MNGISSFEHIDYQLEFAWVTVVTGVHSQFKPGLLCVQDSMSKQSMWAVCGTMHTIAWRYFHITVAVKPDITVEICGSET